MCLKLRLAARSLPPGNSVISGSRVSARPPESAERTTRATGLAVLPSLAVAPVPRAACLRAAAAVTSLQWAASSQDAALPGPPRPRTRVEAAVCPADPVSGARFSPPRSQPARRGDSLPCPPALPPSPGRVTWGPGVQPVLRAPGPSPGSGPEARTRGASLPTVPGGEPTGRYRGQVSGPEQLRNHDTRCQPRTRKSGGKTVCPAAQGGEKALRVCVRRGGRALTGASAWGRRASALTEGENVCEPLVSCICSRSVFRGTVSSGTLHLKRLPCSATSELFLSVELHTNTPYTDVFLKITRQPRSDPNVRGLLSVGLCHSLDWRMARPRCVWCVRLCWLPPASSGGKAGESSGLTRAHQLRDLRTVVALCLGRKRRNIIKVPVPGSAFWVGRRAGWSAEANAAHFLQPENLTR
uniref:translation initiation factor IF-2-like isoform X2 n=1 Tax=Halichoerus grypus TaxID=9711 RepID=UPI0016597986|nr:translation initiation factor IF-2-like isoform X2 [Halichoerus grypus]